MLFKNLESMLKVAEIDKAIEFKQNKDKKQKVEKYIPPNFNDLKIKAIDTNKNKIEQRHLMKHNILPRHPGCSIICG